MRKFKLFPVQKELMDSIKELPRVYYMGWTGASISPYAVMLFRVMANKVKSAK